MTPKTIILLSAVLSILFLASITGQVLLPHYASSFGAPAKTYSVPVYIEDTAVPVIAIRFSTTFDHEKIRLVSVKNTNLTKNWDEPAFYCPERGRCNIAMVYDGNSSILPNSSGPIALLKFKVRATELPQTQINFTYLELSTSDYSIGTAALINGTISPTNVPETDYPAFWMVS